MSEEEAARRVRELEAALDAARARMALLEAQMADLAAQLGRDVQPALVIGRQGVNHNTLVYQYWPCYTMPSYCTGALSRLVT